VSRSSFGQAKGADPTPAENRFGPGRHHPGKPGDIISERWAGSFRKGGRHHFGKVGGIISEWWAGSSRHAGRLRPDFAAKEGITEKLPEDGMPHENRVPTDGNNYLAFYRVVARKEPR
jgi:hypothetical protein